MDGSAQTYIHTHGYARTPAAVTRTSREQANKLHNQHAKTVVSKPAVVIVLLHFVVLPISALPTTLSTFAANTLKTAANQQKQKTGVHTRTHVAKRRRHK